MKTIFRFLLLMMLFSSWGLRSFAQSVSPGLWKSRTEIEINSVPMPPIPIEDCLGSKDAKDIRNYIQENLMPETKCQITKWEFKKPKLKASLSCKNSQGTSQGHLGGEIADKSFDISGTLDGDHVIMGSVEISVHYKGSYVKACKN